MSTLQQLIRSGVCVLYNEFDQGHALDLSGNGNHGTIASTVLVNKYGVDFPSGTSKINISDSSSLRLTMGSIIVYGRNLLVRPPNATSVFIAKRDGGGLNYQFFLVSRSQVNFRAGSVVSHAFSGQPKSIAVNFSHGTIPECFIDGVSDGNFSSSTDVVSDDADVTVGGLYYANSNYNNAIERLVVCNRILTDDEHYEIFKELSVGKLGQHSFGRSSNISHEMHSSCVGAYDGVFKRGKFRDLSSQENHMDVTDDQNNVIARTPIGYAVSAANVTPKTAQKLTGRPMGFGCWFKPYGTDTEQLFGQVFESFRMWYGDTANTVDVRLDSNSKVVTFSDASVHGTWSHYMFIWEDDGTIRLYRDGEEDVVARDLFTNFWTAVSSDIKLGTDGSGIINGLVTRGRMYVGELTANDVKTEYNRSASVKVFYLSNDIKVIPQTLTSGKIGGLDVVSGSWNVNASLVASEAKKYVDCLGTGRIVLDMSSIGSLNDAAIGTYDFEYYKGSVDGIRTRIVFNADVSDDYNDGSQNGYMLEMRTDDGTFRVDLRKLTGGSETLLGSSSNNVIVSSTWQKWRVTKNSLGVIRVYVDGVLVITVTDTTYTTSRYVNFSIATGDRITRLVKTFAAIVV